MNLGLQGRIVLVTGGVRGVGAGISAVFAGQGAIVVTCARRPVEGLPFEFHSCDVRDPDAVAVLIDTIVAEHGRLDVVVNNAGGSPYALAADASPRFHQKIIELNLLGMLHVSQAANAVMQGQDHGGSIISISSISGSRPSPGTAAYGAAKAGLKQLTTTLAMEWAPKIRVNTITVGLILTEQAALFYGEGEARERIEAGIPMGRFAMPSDIGDIAVWLGSDLAAYVTGAEIAAHGGGERPPFLGTE